MHVLDFERERAEINTYCAECQAWQPHYLITLNSGERVLRCQACGEETHSKTPADDAQPRLLPD